MTTAKRCEHLSIPSSFVLRHSSFRSRGFTLIELMIVVAIIIVLAGLILGTSGYIQKKGARSRASAEIAALSAALEGYKADNGIYPRDNATDSLKPESATLSSYTSASRYLYQELSGDRDLNRALDAGSKSYFAFKPNMLSPVNQDANVTALRDPFGNSYGYSTIKAADPTSTSGFNPTFDLWSTGGTTTTSAADQLQWIKNW